MSNKMHTLRILAVNDVKQILEFVTIVMNDWEHNTGFQGDEPNMSLQDIIEMITHEYDDVTSEMTQMELQERALYLNRLEVAQIIKHGAI